MFLAKGTKLVGLAVVTVGLAAGKVLASTTPAAADTMVIPCTAINPNLGGKILFIYTPGAAGALLLDNCQSTSTRARLSPQLGTRSSSNATTFRTRNPWVHGRDSGDHTYGCRLHQMPPHIMYWSSKEPTPEGTETYRSGLA